MSEKQCNTCHAVKPLDKFPTHRETIDRHTNRCKSCTLAYQREQRRRNGNAYTYRYERSRPGFLMRVYRNMQSRVTGVQWRKSHLYLGKPIISRQDFYAWSEASPEFSKLFDAWEAAGRPRRTCPSIDRIDSTKGYELANMRWVTFSENCAHTSARKPISRSTQ